MIRLAIKTDLDAIERVYAKARQFMCDNNNPTQWNGGYPSRELLLSDIQKAQLYVTEEEGSICGCFALIDGVDPTYSVIDGGAWRSDAPYGTLHRVASDGSKKGFFAKTVAFARKTYDHLRIDTHEANLPMQHVILAQGFLYCGIIYLEDGDPRMAYEWIKE